MTQEIIEMARQAGFDEHHAKFDTRIEAFAKLVAAKAAAKEREACARKVEEFARKWWKIHCDSNLHYSSTLRAHQDFCALQAAIRARGEQA
jgi:hypothetical protein